MNRQQHDALVKMEKSNLKWKDYIAEEDILHELSRYFIHFQNEINKKLQVDFIFILFSICFLYNVKLDLVSY